MARKSTKTPENPKNIPLNWLFWLKLYGENDLSHSILVEKERATRKHFEASVEKREPREHFSASAYGLGFKNLSLGSLFSTLASKTFYLLPFFSTSITWEKPNYTWNIFPESSQNNYSNKILFSYCNCNFSYCNIFQFLNLFGARFCSFTLVL